MRGKHAASVAKRREIGEVIAERDALRHRSERLSKERDALKEQVAECERTISELRAALKSEAKAAAEPEVRMLRERCQQLTEENRALTAERDADKKKRDDEFSRMMAYVMAVDPAKPTPTEALGVLVTIYSGRDSLGVWRPDNVTHNRHLQEIKNNIARRMGAGRHPE